MASSLFSFNRARDGEQISNSYALEKHGWDGVCIEPFPTNFKEAGRTCMLAREVLSNSTGDVVSFVMPDKNSIYGRGCAFQRPSTCMQNAHLLCSCNRSNAAPVAERHCSLGRTCDYTYWFAGRAS